MQPAVSWLTNLLHITPPTPNSPFVDLTSKIGTQPNMQNTMQEWDLTKPHYVVKPWNESSCCVTCSTHCKIIWSLIKFTCFYSQLTRLTQSVAKLCNETLFHQRRFPFLLSLLNTLLLDPVCGFAIYVVNNVDPDLEKNNCHQQPFLL